MTPFVCPICGAVSHNPNDARNRYCGACRVFPDDLSARRRVEAEAAYRDDRFPERACDHCGKPAVYCSLACAIADA